MCLEQFKTPDWITLDFIRNEQPSVPRSQYASKGTFALPLPAVFPGEKRTQAGHLSESDSLSISSWALQPQGSSALLPHNASLLQGSGKVLAWWLWLRLYGVPQPHAQSSDILTCTGCQHAGSDGGREGQGRAQGGIDNSGGPGFQHPPANGAPSLGALPTAHRALVEEERINECKSYEVESNACSVWSLKFTMPGKVSAPERNLHSNVQSLSCSHMLPLTPYSKGSYEHFTHS